MPTQAQALSAARKIKAVISTEQIPDDERDAAIQEVLRRTGFQSIDDIRQMIGGTVTGFGQQALKGATIGLDDEITGFVAGDEARESERLEKQLFEHTNPVQSVAGQITGLAGAALATRGASLRLATGLRLGKIASDVAERLGRTFTGRLGRGAITGATGAAVEGFNEGQGGFQNRAQQAGRGALEGAIVGGPLDAVGSPVLHSVAGGTANFILNFLRPISNTLSPAAAERRARSVAREDIASRLTQSPEEVAQELKRRRALGVPAVAGDIDQGLQDAASGVSASGTPAGARLVEELDIRQRGPKLPALPGQRDNTKSSGGRVIRALDTALDTPERGLGFLSSLEGRQTQTAAPLYEAALPMVLPRNQTVATILKTPNGSKAIKEAQAALANKVEVDPATGAASTKELGDIIDKDGNVAILTVETIDQIKRGFDRAIAKDLRKNPERARDLIRNKNLLLEKVDLATAKTAGDRTSSPYWQARNAWAGDAQVATAYEAGTLWTRRSLNAEQLDAELGKVVDLIHDGDAVQSASVREAFRAGALQSIEDLIVTAPDGADAVRKLIGSEGNRRKLRRLFDDESKFNRLMDILSAEGDATRLFNRTVKGIDSAGRRAQQEIAAEAEGRTNRGLVQMVLDAAEGPGKLRNVQSAADERRRMIMATDPSVVREMPVPRDAPAPGSSIGNVAAPFVAGQQAQGLLLDENDVGF